MSAVDTTASDGTQRIASLLDGDHELKAAVPADELALARRAVSGPLVTIGPGPCTAAIFELRREPGMLGFFILEGVLSHDVVLGNVSIPDLVGPGDVLGPEAVPHSSLPARTRFYVVEEVRGVVLGERFARACGHWPALLTVLERRRSGQRDRLAVMGSIGHLPRVDLRLQAALWHLVEEWGYSTPEGVVLPFPLTHYVLGRFVGARRSTVSLALAALEDRALVVRRPDGSYLLPNGSLADLRESLAAESHIGPVTIRARTARARAQASRASSAAARQRATETAEEAKALTAEARLIAGRRRSR